MLIRWTLRLSEYAPSDQCFVLQPDPEKPNERTIVYSSHFRSKLQRAYCDDLAANATSGFIPPLTAEQLLISFCESKLAEERRARSRGMAGLNTEVS